MRGHLARALRELVPTLRAAGLPGAAALVDEAAHELNLSSPAAAGSFVPGGAPIREDGGSGQGVRSVPPAGLVNTSGDTGCVELAASARDAADVLVERFGADDGDASHAAGVLRELARAVEQPGGFVPGGGPTREGGHGFPDRLHTSGDATSHEVQGWRFVESAAVLGGVDLERLRGFLAEAVDRGAAASLSGPELTTVALILGGVLAGRALSGRSQVPADPAPCSASGPGHPEDPELRGSCYLRAGHTGPHSVAYRCSTGVEVISWDDWPRRSDISAECGAAGPHGRSCHEPAGHDGPHLHAYPRPDGQLDGRAWLDVDHGGGR